MAESISTLEGLQGYKAAVAAPLYKQEAEDQATLLSTQAEAAKAKMAAYKEEQGLQAQRRATLGILARERSDIDMSSIEGQLKLSDIAIQQSKNNPVLMERFQEEKQGLLKRRAEELKINAQSREEERAQKYDALSTALAAPELASNLITSGDPALQHFGEMITDKKPILQFRDTSGKPKLYSQLSGEELSRFREQVLSGVAPKGDAAALGRYSQHEIDWAREQERIRNDDLRAKLKEQDIAAKRDKIASTVKEKEDKLAASRAKFNRQKDVDTKKIEDAQAKILTGEGLISPTDTKEVFGIKYKELSPAGKAAYEILENQKEQVKSTWEENLATLGGEPTSKKEVQYTKESPAKPTSKETFAKLPSGSWFINPADGKILQKK